MNNPDSSTSLPVTGSHNPATLDPDLYREMVHAFDQGFCVCEVILNENGAPVDYRFLEVNHSFERLTGLADPVGKTALELVIDGFELARRMVQHPLLKTTNLIAVTGYGQERDRQASAEAGFVAHLVKPVDADELQTVLQSLESNSRPVPNESALE